MFTSLAGGIATLARIIAIQERLKLDGMQMMVEGTIDQEMILGKSRENGPRVEGINVALGIDAEMTEKEKEAFVHEMESRCPVSDNLSCTTPTKVGVV